MLPSRIARALLVLSSLNLTALAAADDGSASLLGIYQAAMEREPQLAAARHEYQATREQIPQARSKLLPTLSAGATSENIWLSRNAAKGSGRRVAVIDGRQEIVDGGQGRVKQSGSGTIWQAQLNQPLFHLDSWYQLKAAHAAVDSADAELAAKQQQLIFNSAKAYFQALQAQDELSAKKAEEDSLKKQWDQTQARLKDGVSSITDVLDAKAAYDVARAERKSDERKLDDAFEAITRLTGDPVYKIDGMLHDLPILPPEPANIQAWTQKAMTQSRHLQSAALAVTAAEKQLTQRRAGHLPTLDLTASYQNADNDAYGYLNPQDDGTDAWNGRVTRKTIGIQLNVPLYSGGEINSQVRESVARLSQSRDQWENARREVLEQTRNAFRAIDSDIDQIAARRQTILSSAESLKANRVGVDLGTRNTADVLNAQKQLYSAVRDYNNARYDFIVNTLTLKQAVGTLSPADLQSLAAYAKKDYDPQRDFLPPGVDVSKTN